MEHQEASDPESVHFEVEGDGNCLCPLLPTRPTVPTRGMPHGNEDREEAQSHLQQNPLPLRHHS